MKREFKRQIKQDEFVTGVQRARQWLETHRDEARVTALVLAVVAAGAFALAYLQGRRAEEAEQAMAAALEIFRGPVEAELPEGAERPAGPIYATAQEKFTKAAAAFDGVERKYGSLPVALRARYYGALCRSETGDVAEAQRILADVAARKLPGSLEPALARLALAEVYRRSGQLDRAIGAYREIVEDASLPLPRDHALIGLASLLEEARRYAEARAAYLRIGEEFPTSVYAGEARRRADYLESAAKG